jgi:hypothetical protein
MENIVESASLFPIYPHMPFVEMTNYSNLMLQWNTENMYQKSLMFSKESSIKTNFTERDCQPQERDSL